MSKRRVRLLLALGLAAAAAPAMAATAEIKYVLQCGNAKSVPLDEQYRDLRFWSEGNADYWSGTSVKYPDRTMVGRIGIHSKRQWIEYVEKHYRGGKLESTTTFACRPIKPEIREEDWKEGGRKS
jgi:hypothetical protein